MILTTTKLLLLQNEIRIHEIDKGADENVVRRNFAQYGRDCNRPLPSSPLPDSSSHCTKVVSGSTGSILYFTICFLFLSLSTTIRSKVCRPTKSNAPSGGG